jgi:predicted AlkP superfamily pyrophosphatase or phosphodiesterase
MVCYVFQLASTLHFVDDLIGQLICGLQQHNMDQCANILVVADHGDLLLYTFSPSVE